MLKLLVGLSLAALISGNVISPQNNGNPQQVTNCESSEVLLKVWKILSDLLGPNEKSVKVPDVNQIKYALTLIKKSLEKNPAPNHEPSKKLQHFENELSQNKEFILNDKKPLRFLLEADPVKNDLSSNMLFRYDLPSNIRPSCKAAFLNLINVAQEAYVNMAKSPVCTDANAALVPNKSNFANYVPNQNPYNSALLSPSEEALKKVTEYLKAPENYNSNNVVSLLKSLQQKVPYVSPLHYELNLHPQSQINIKDLNEGQNHALNKLPDINSNNNINAANYNSPLQSDFNMNLEHAKDIANKLNAPNQYKHESPNTNGEPTPKEDASHLSGGGGIINFSPNKQMSPAELQKVLYKSVVNGNNDNVQNYMHPQQSQNNLYQPPGYYYTNPYQNLANNEIIKKLIGIEPPNNIEDNFNNNNFYPGQFNYPGNVNHDIYQDKLPNTQLPIKLSWPYNLNNNPALNNQANDANGIANAGKLETNIRPKGQVELTYLLKRKRPLIYQPFYFVKYRLPYNYFIQNLKQMLSLERGLSTPPTELYKGLIAPSNTTEVSPDLASYPKEEIHNLVLKEGALVKAKYIEANETDENGRTKNAERESSEYNFAGGDILKQKDESSKTSEGLNEYNGPINTGGFNLPYPVANQAVGNQAASYQERMPLRQDNQSLEKLLAASSRLNSLYRVENHPYRQETSMNMGDQYYPYLNQKSVNQVYSAYNQMQPAASSQLNPPYLIDNQAVQSNPHYVLGNKAALSQNYRPYLQAYQSRQETPLAKVGYQILRPPYVSGVNQVSPVQRPYILGTQAALGLNNKFLGNNLISNNLQAYRQSRRLLGGFLNPYQYGYNRPGLYPNPNGLGSPYPGMLDNQGILGQPAYGNNLGNGLELSNLNPQPHLYG